jgi:putative amide transporter protein
MRRREGDDTCNLDHDQRNVDSAGPVLHGEGGVKTSALVTAVVGVLTAVGGYYQGAQGDLLTSGALLAFSVLYLAVAYALFAGVQDMRTIGNSALTVALVCGISAFLLLTEGRSRLTG